MIVTYSEEGWKIVTQRAHGMLAAAIASCWKKRDRPKRWLETILAIAEHDDAEIELDGENLLTDNGGPLNYSMKKFDLRHCEKVLRMTTTKSRYITLLTAMHLEFLYRKEKRSNKSARKFLTGLKKQREILATDLGLEIDELDRAYDFMEWCDAFSLLLCEEQLQPEKRMTEISTGPDKKHYQVVQLNEQEIYVDPWPFEINAFQVSFEHRILKALSFGSSLAFRKAFLNAEIRTTHWQIIKKPATFRSPGKVSR